MCFPLHSDTNRRIYIHGGIMDTHGCTLLLFHFIDHDWVRTYTLKSNLYSMTKQFNCLFVCLRIFIALVWAIIYREMTRTLTIGRYIRLEPHSIWLWVRGFRELLDLCTHQFTLYVSFLQITHLACRSNWCNADAQRILWDTAIKFGATLRWKANQFRWIGKIAFNNESMLFGSRPLYAATWRWNSGYCTNTPTCK